MEWRNIVPFEFFNQIGDYPPTDQALAVKDELTKLINIEIKNYREILATDLPKFNQMIRDHAVDAIILKKE